MSFFILYNLFFHLSHHRLFAIEVDICRSRWRCLGSIPRGYSKMGSYPRCSTFEHTLNFKETTYIQYEDRKSVV